MPEKAVEVLNKDKKPEVTQYASQAEIVKAMEADPALRDEFLAAQGSGKMDAFVTKYQKPAAEKAPDGEGSHAKPPEKVKDPPPVDNPDEEIAVRVRRKDLGTYIKNRKPEEAIAEVIKGKAEADKTIDFLKTERVPALERDLGAATQENKTLKQQLAEYEARKAKEALNPPPAAAASADVEIPADLEDKDLDLLEPENQKKVAAYLKAITGTTKALVAKNTAQAKEIAELKSGIQKTEERVETVAKTVVTDNAAANEEDEIVRMRKRNADIFVSDRPRSEIEGDYRGFLENLRVVAGVKEPVFDDKGQFTAGIVSAYNQYYSKDDSGKALRDKCETSAVKPPDDLDDLTKIEKVQAIRKQYGVLNSRTGKYDPLPYEEALQKLVQGDATLGTIRTKARAEGQSDYERALANRGAKAKEVTVRDSADPADLAGITLQDMQARLDSYYAAQKEGKATPEERAILENIFRLKGMSAEEIKTRLGG